MNKIIKLSAVLLSSLIALSGCGEKKEEVNHHTYNEETPNFVNKTVHNVNVKQRDLVFFFEGETDYKIIYPADSSLGNKAALFLKQYLGNASGGNIECIPYNATVTYSTESKYIVLNVPELINAANVKKTDIDLKTTGYQITTKDKSAFIFVNHSYGYQQAAYSFLVNVIGYDRISKNIVLYKNKAETLPELDIVEIPDFQIRTQSNKVDIDYSYETGFLTSTEVFYHDKDVPFVHNSTSYGSQVGWVPNTLSKEHPEWFSEKLNQICYTAHGNQESYNQLVDYVFNKLKDALTNSPDCTRFSFTCMDNRDCCQCDECKKSELKYGAASAAVIKFLNSVDAKVQNYLQELADQSGTAKRKMELVFFAYNAYEAAPVKLENNQFVATYPEVVCNENVSVYIAPITANFTKSFIDEANTITRDTIEGWTALCKSINYWLYETNFSEYLFPFNSFSGMANTYRYVVDKHASYMYNEGQHNQDATTAFGRFKEYFNQKFLINVNSDYNEIVNHFFKEYFKDGSEPMLKFFNEVQSHSEYLLTEYYGELTGSIYDKIAKEASYWPKNLLDRWIGYINEAYKAVERYRNSDIGLYNTLINNIKLESIFPRYALVTLHSTKYGAEELYSMEESIYRDGVDLGITQVAEGTPFSSLKGAWGIE